ncbi:MAG: ABC transporter ATP-binding protein [Spirochaetes bacterium]|nr:ABC transporter ATP-binding protein [Spirochaetota bacterium]
MDFIKVLNLSKTYKTGSQEVKALRNINLDINKGDFISIVGPSGSGKTTLLNLLGCIDIPDSGKYYFLDNELTSFNKEKLTLLRREKFGFIFQNFNLIKVLNVFENVAITLELLNLKKHEIEEKVHNILKETKLSGLENRLPNELSGGQQQRVAIARALVKNPVVVFADEPTANLDHKTGAEIVTLMKELNEKYGTTFIFSTHDSKIMELAKKIIYLEDGEIIKN